MPCLPQRINVLYSCYSSLLDFTQPALQTRPKTISVARPNKKCCGPQYYSLNNWISHWCKVLSFHWTTLMQDTLDITNVGHEYDFTWLYILETGYSILYSERIQHKSTTTVWLTRIQGCKPPPWQAKCKHWVPIMLIFQYSVLFWFSVSCFLSFSEVFGLLFSGDFGFFI